MAKSNKAITPDPKVPADSNNLVPPNPSVVVNGNGDVSHNSTVTVDAVSTASPDPAIRVDQNILVVLDPTIPVDAANIDTAAPVSISNDAINLPDDSNVIDEYMQPYLATYPDEIIFFVATDGQVFLSTAENDARNHQRKLDHTRELFEYFRG